MTSPKPICNILALLLPLMWFVWEPGSMEMNALPHVSPLPRGFTVQLKASFPTVSKEHETQHETNESRSAWRSW
jgi:hypothetical protein